MLPPSSLPSWWELNSILVEEAKRLTLDACSGLPAEAIERIRALSLSSFPVESLSDLLVNGFAGETWFSVLEILDGTVTNANHRALARLAARSVVQVLVTTNFDTLIERAFREEGLRLAVLSSDADLAHPPQLQASATLLKIHGTVTESATLVDTVTQKLRGLPLSIRHTLDAVFHDQHVLVVGYSGADLSFGDDYLALSGVSPHTPGITWLVPPQYRDSVPARVREAVERAGAGGCIVYDTLPEFWERLGVDVPASPAGSDAIAADTAAARVRSSIEAFYQQLHVGPLNAACFVLSLLGRIGDRVTAAHLTDALAAHPSLQGPAYPIASVGVMARIGSSRAEHGDLDEAERWTRQSIAAQQELARMLGKEEPKPLEEHHRNLAASYNNLGLYAMRRGDLDRAAGAFDQARRHAEAVDARSLLSLVTMNCAQLGRKRGDPTEQVLAELRRALHWAGTCGYGQVLAEAGVAEAEQLMHLAEYWAAGKALERAEPYLWLKSGARMRWVAAMTRAELEIRRRSAGRAAEILEEAIRTADEGGDEHFAGDLRACWVRLLACEPALKERTLEHLAELARAGRFDEETRRRFAGDVLSLPDDARPPLPLSFSGMDEEERSLRSALADAGFHADWRTEARILETLAHRHSGHPARMLELARALHAATVCAGDPEYTAHALYLVGSALLAGGEVAEADGVLEAALAIPEIALDTRDGVFVRLAELRSRTGAVDEAMRLLTAARESRSTDGDLRGMLMVAAATMRVSLLHADPAGAAEVLHAVARDERLDASYRQGLLDWAEELAGVRTARSPSDVVPDDPAGELPAGVDFETPETDVRLELVWQAWHEGRPREAEEKAAAALTVVRDAGPVEGVLGCASLLERIAAKEQRWADASKYAQMVRSAASSLKRSREEIDSWSRISRYALNLGDIDAAEAAARACDVLSRGLRPSEALAYAWYVLAASAAGRGSGIDALAAARRFLEIADAVNTPPLAPLRTEFREMLDQLSEPRPGPTASARPNLLEEPNRLNRAGRYGEALHQLESLELDAHDPGMLAAIAGVRGNVFQSAGRHPEAVAEYLRAAKLFREVGQHEQAMVADTQRAASMRRDGAVEEAETLLRGLLVDLPEGALRHQVLQTLINTLNERLPALAAAESAALAYEVAALADEAATMPDVGDEARGLLYLNTSTAVLYTGDLERVIEMRRRAVQHLLRCNSQHVDLAREGHAAMVALRDELLGGDNVADTASPQGSQGEATPG